MLSIQKPQPIKPGAKADELAREISAHADQDAAFNRLFGPPGDRKHLPLSLRNAVRDRLSGERPFVTEDPTKGKRKK